MLQSCVTHHILAPIATSTAIIKCDIHRSTRFVADFGNMFQFFIIIGSSCKLSPIQWIKGFLIRFKILDFQKNYRFTSDHLSTRLFELFQEIFLPDSFCFKTSFYQTVFCFKTSFYQTVFASRHLSTRQFLLSLFLNTKI